MLADVERGVTRDREHQLKYRGRVPQVRRVPARSATLRRGQVTTEQALERAGWDRATDYERGLLLEIFGLEAAPPNLAVRDPRRPSRSRSSPRPRPASPARSSSAEMDALVDGLVRAVAGEADAAPDGRPRSPGHP